MQGQRAEGALQGIVYANGGLDLLHVERGNIIPSLSAIVVTGLPALAAAGLCHGDIYQGNVIFKDDVSRLIDVGLMRTFSDFAAAPEHMGRNGLIDPPELAYFAGVRPQTHTGKMLRRLGVVFPPEPASGDLRLHRAMRGRLRARRPAPEFRFMSFTRSRRRKRAPSA